MICAAAIAMAGCASTTPLATPSGNPEVTLRGMTQQAASDHIATMCANGGRTVENQTASTVTCSMTVTDVFMQAMTGPSQAVTQYALIKQADGTRVIVSSAWLQSTNGFGAVTRHPMDIRKGKIAQDLQTRLTTMANSVNGTSN